MKSLPIVNRIREWFKLRTVHCHFCGITSGRVYPELAERMARNHSRFTGHANVGVHRKAPK